VFIGVSVEKRRIFDIRGFQVFSYDKSALVL